MKSKVLKTFVKYDKINLFANCDILINTPIFALKIFFLNSIQYLMKKEKFEIRVLIENDRVYIEEYNVNQKVQVIVNKTIENLNITSEDRELRREDGTPISNLSLRIDETTIRDGETLRYFKKSSKPDRNKGFA